MAESTVPVTQQEESTIPATRDTSRCVVPPVDIYETPDGLAVVADLPGVESKDVDIRVENNVLTIRGKVIARENGDRIYAEFELCDFLRQFQLSQEVDQEKISAETKNGVLTVHLPKQEAAKPRQIEVKVG